MTFTHELYEEGREDRGGGGERGLASCCQATVTSTGKRGHFAPVAAGGWTRQQADEAHRNDPDGPPAQ